MTPSRLIHRTLPEKARKAADFDGKSVLQLHRRFKGSCLAWPCCSNQARCRRRAGACLPWVASRSARAGGLRRVAASSEAV
jgi:hypothetical protein